MKKLILLSIIVSFLSCNDKEKQVKTEIPKPITKELVVKIEFKTSKEDIFKLMLNNVIVDEFQKKSIQIYETVPLSADFENINASFGDDNFSNNFSFNLGKEQKEIKFKTIEFSYGENTIQITADNYNNFLRSNKFIEFNEGDFSLKTKSIEGKHNPVIFGRKTLIDSLRKQAN